MKKKKKMVVIYSVKIKRKEFTGEILLKENNKSRKLS
jgi:hypothetical protein